MSPMPSLLPHRANPLLLAAVVLLSVQGVLRSQEADTSATKGLVYAKETPDSVLKAKVHIFRYDPAAVKIEHVAHPTLDPTSIHRHDPLDAFDGTFHLSTGTIGHAHYCIFPSAQTRLHHRLQTDAIDMPGDDTLLLFQTQTPYSLLAYQSSLDKDYQLELTHSQNILPGWNATFNYQLTNPEGVFANSAARNHRLSVSSNYFSPDSRLQVAAAYQWHSFTVDENGGLTDDTYFTSGQQTNFAGLPMVYSNGGAEHTRRRFVTKATYNLVRQHDTAELATPRIFNAGVVGVEGGYQWRKRAAYLSDGADSTLWNELHANLFWTNDAYPDYRWRNPLKVTLGLTPRRIHAELTNDTLTATSVLNPFARVTLSHGRLTVRADAQADRTLAQAMPDWAKTDWDAVLKLEAALDSLSRNTIAMEASEMHHMPEVRMLLTSAQPLKQSATRHYGMQYAHREGRGFLQKLDISLRATQREHHTWYDSSLAPRQGDTALWVLQASVAAHVKVGIVHLEMLQMLQHSSDEGQMPLPLWASKNSLYVDMRLFRGALRMQVGTDIRFHTLFHADGYDPTTGLFYRQDDEEVGNYFWGDVFVNLQVKQASLYLKAGHVNALWESEPGYMLLPHYPGNKFGLYWGLAWHFFD